MGAKLETEREPACRIVLFGSMGPAVECLEWLLARPGFKVLGVVCSRKPRAAWRVATGDPDMQEIAPSLGVPMLALDDLADMEADLGLSVRFHEILRERHLSRFRLGVVNLHGAPLPEMRGSMCDAAAILEDRREYGTSLHWMDTRIDTGDLLAVKRFPIEEHHTVYDLFRASNEHGLQLIKDHLEAIASGAVKGEAQSRILERESAAARTYYAKDVVKRKALPHDTDGRQLWNTVRAFQFPGHEPAYLETGHGRVHLAISPEEAGRKRVPKS